VYNFENFLGILENKIDLNFMDEYGYPSEEALEILSNWDYGDPIGWLQFAKSLWHFSDYVYFTKVEYYDGIEDVINFATGGWSGNESIVSAMSCNRMLWGLYWYFSKRGGLYSFFYSESK
jgi:hypothetical protein